MSAPAARTRPRIKGLLIDLSGNLHIGSSPTPNAVEAFHRLQQAGIPFRLCSNTSKESTAAVIQRLTKMGFNMPNVHSQSDLGGRDGRLVWTSVSAVAQLLKNLNAKSPFFMLSDSARHEVVEAMSDHQNPSPGSANREDEVASPESEYDSVVIGLAPQQFDYSNLNTAFRILKGEQSSQSHKQSTVNGKEASLANRPLIATHKAKYIQTESGLSLGPGPFVTALESAVGIQAHVVGKPTRQFFEMVIQDMHPDMSDTNTNGDKIAIIGDDVEADLGGGAVELGLWRVLVKTGKYRSGDEHRDGVIPPDEVFDSFAAFVETLLEQKS